MKENEAKDGREGLEALARVDGNCSDLVMSEQLLLSSSDYST